MKIIFSLMAFVLFSCASSDKGLTAEKAKRKIELLDQSSKDQISFLMEVIETQSAERTSIPYEFVIPLNAKMKRQVHRIDPSMKFFPRSGFYQCIGEGVSKEKLIQIVALSYTQKIKYCPFE
jgi:hypothetical protein